MRVLIRRRANQYCLQAIKIHDILSGMKFEKGGHTKYRLMYHIVWIPKYRKRILKGAVAQRIVELLVQCAEINGWQMQELNVQEDHIHMIVRLDPKTSVARAVQLFKGGSSRVLRKEYPELEEFLWGSSFWSDGYFVETVGRCSEEVIRKYVREQ